MSTSIGTKDRDAKLLSLKRNIAWACCSDLLSPPLPVLEQLRFQNTDDEETKRIKRAEHRRASEEREKERIRREPELLNELDKVMERVKSARSSYSKTGINYNAISEAYRVMKFYCDRCKNQVDIITLTYSIKQFISIVPLVYPPFLKGRE